MRRTTRRSAYCSLLIFATIFLFGCPKANQDYQQGRKAESIGDFDTALVHYERALRADPTDTEYKLRTLRMRSADGQFHVEQGEKALQQGNLELALAEFQKAAAIDPGNTAAPQEAQKTMGLIQAKRAASQPKSQAQSYPTDQELLTGPPQLKPLSREPINLTETSTCRPAFEAVAKWAGLSVIFDPEFDTQGGQSRKITTNLPNVTLEQALDAVSLECNAFWKPVTDSVIFVAQDNATKRQQLEDQEIQTFYLKNTTGNSDKEGADIVTAIRAALKLSTIAQVTEQNAIVIRATPDQLALAGRMIHDLDQARPEILLHIQVLSVNRDRLRDLGILPGQSISATFNPRSALQSSTTNNTGGTPGTTASAPQVALNNIEHIGLGDWSATLPGATANAILTDSKTQVIQDPEIRMTEGEKTVLNVGEKIPYASGSFLGGGVGVGSVGVSSLVQTQFQQQDVGVIITVDDSRVHPDGDVSITMHVEISAVSGEQTIGNLQEPIISQRKIDPIAFRLKNGESSVLGGMIERDEITSRNGIPGVSQVPIFRYLFSDNSHHVTDQEVLIVVTPHVVRFPSITAADMTAVGAGTDRVARVYRKSDEALPAPQPQDHATTPQPPGSQPNQQPNSPAAAQLRFQPANVSIKPGDTTTVGLAIANVNDLFSMPLLIHYNPAVIQVEEVRDGGFLSGGNQQIAIVQRIDPQRGEVVVSATRQPNTKGVNGSGTLLGFVVRGVAPGNGTLQILEVNARNSQQQPIPITSGEASIRVQ
ncbi:MAG TPA: cohesin domain-containing protein [Candidatus Acidoferrales bacterium]|nr:cohesin domain-containing protein [Candidatus Acidoferrales bacterium]